jgi:hypothetical protein
VLRVPPDLPELRVLLGLRDLQALKAIKASPAPPALRVRRELQGRQARLVPPGLLGLPVPLAQRVQLGRV